MRQMPRLGPVWRRQAARGGLVVALASSTGCSTDDVDCYLECLPKSQALIDFERNTSDAELYAEAGLTQTLSGGEWRISGTAAADTAFGLRFPCITNALQYEGLQVHMTAEPGVRLRWEVITVSNQQGAGTCTDPGVCEGEDCRPAANNINVLPQFGPVRQWGNFSSAPPGTSPAEQGAAQYTPFPGELLGIRWVFREAVDDVEIVVDELRYHGAETAE